MKEWTDGDLSMRFECLHIGSLPMRCGKVENTELNRFREITKYLIWWNGNATMTHWYKGTFIQPLVSNWKCWLITKYKCFSTRQHSLTVRAFFTFLLVIVYIKFPWITSSNRKRVRRGNVYVKHKCCSRDSRSMENSCERSDFFVHDHSSNPFARKLSTTSYTDAILVHPLPPQQALMHGMHVHGLHVHAQQSANNRLQVMPELHVLSTEATSIPRSCSGPRDQTGGTGPMSV